MHNITNYKFSIDGFQGSSSVTLSIIFDNNNNNITF